MRSSGENQPNPQIRAVSPTESPYLDPYVIPGTFDGDYENGASEC